MTNFKSDIEYINHKPVRNNTWLEGFWDLEKCTYLRVFDKLELLKDLEPSLSSDPIPDNELSNYMFVYKQAPSYGLQTYDESPKGLIHNNKLYKYHTKYALNSKYGESKDSQRSRLNKFLELGFDKIENDYSPFFYCYKLIGDIEDKPTKYRICKKSYSDKPLYVSNTLLDSLSERNNPETTEAVWRYGRLLNQKLKLDPTQTYQYEVLTKFEPRILDQSEIMLFHKEDDIKLINSVFDSEIVLEKECYELQQRYFYAIESQIMWFLNVIQKDIYYVPYDKYLLDRDFDSYVTPNYKNGTNTKERITCLADTVALGNRNVAMYKQKNNKKLTKKEKILLDGGFTQKTSNKSNCRVYIQSDSYRDSYVKNSEVLELYNNGHYPSLDILQMTLRHVSQIIFNELNKHLIVGKPEETIKEKINIRDVVSSLNKKLTDLSLPVKCTFDDSYSVVFKCDDALYNILDRRGFNSTFTDTVEKHLEQEFSLTSISWKYSNTQFHKTVDGESVFK